MYAVNVVGSLNTPIKTRYVGFLLLSGMLSEEEKGNEKNQED